MATQKSLDEAYMRCAKAIAALSHAERKKVGAILVSSHGHGIIAEGYNGTPSGFDNVCEVGNVTKPEVLHAESNAITKVARSTNSSECATMYVTCAPCFECSKLIIQAGIIRVVYEEEYRFSDGPDLLLEAGILVEKL